MDNKKPKYIVASHFSNAFQNTLASPASANVSECASCSIPAGSTAAEQNDNAAAFLVPARAKPSCRVERRTLCLKNCRHPYNLMFICFNRKPVLNTLLTARCEAFLAYKQSWISVQTLIIFFPRQDT
jgi:hypothetical protein